MKAHGLKHIDGAASVDLEISDRIRHPVGHRNLGCQVKHGTGFPHCIDDRDRIADIGDNDVDPVTMAGLQPLGILADAGAGEIVQDEDVITAFGEPIGGCSR